MGAADVPLPVLPAHGAGLSPRGPQCSVLHKSICAPSTLDDYKCSPDVSGVLPASGDPGEGVHTGLSPTQLLAGGSFLLPSRGVWEEVQ